MIHSTHERIAMAQQVLEQLNSLTGLGGELAGRLANEEDRAHALHEAKQAAVRRLVAARMDAAESVTAEPDRGASLLGVGLRMATGGGGAAGAQMALMAARQLADAYVDYAKFAQVETTKRAQIDAWRQTTTEQIHSTRQVLELYLERTFDERRQNFGRMFEALDEAQVQGDLPGMQLMLSGILDLAKSSPFRDLAEFEQRLNDPTFVLDL
ncbi:hypothetical protein QOL99_04720 [Deinococcus sp. MIMF12]|uniref:Uncharacterized protein n=1 Tax=Deinococcus rhizophilus TaxID=3049544 RepID=A0ABT7JEH3_9DEIO|nr:hypothetical protein [Deinococcus rhizophilus]MDL2343453.1 hypothetical protein [Deinococcus rhizophilus]